MVRARREEVVKKEIDPVLKQLEGIMSLRKHDMDIFLKETPPDILARLLSIEGRLNSLPLDEPIDLQDAIRAYTEEANIGGYSHSFELYLKSKNHYNDVRHQYEVLQADRASVIRGELTVEQVLSMVRY